MNKNKLPSEIAEAILARSSCTVKVGAAIADSWGVHAWGWNSSGAGFGQCAERHAIGRANKKRLAGSTIYVASERARNGKVICSKPCQGCQKLIDKWGLKVIWRDTGDIWREGG